MCGFAHLIGDFALSKEGQFNFFSREKLVRDEAKRGATGILETRLLSSGERANARLLKESASFLWATLYLGDAKS